MASIRRLHSVLNFFVNGILICYGCSQIFELFHSFKGFLIILYTLVVAGIWYCEVFLLNCDRSEHVCELCVSKFTLLAHVTCTPCYW
jgi:hypothetical protein